MSILTENSKKMLVESMRECLSDVLHESTSLTSKQATEKIKFVTESATYEQLLNITMNPHREEKYLPSYVLEGAVAILHSACMTGRKNIGPNAIVEGALKLQKKTGAVITESMMDAALAAVTEGCGLKVVGKILNEALELHDAISILRANPEGITDQRLRGEILGAITTSNLNDNVKNNLTRLASNGSLTGSAVRKAIRAQNSLNLANQAVERYERMLAQNPTDQTLKDALRAAKSKANTWQKALNNASLGVTKRGAGSSSFSSNTRRALDAMANKGVGKTPWGKIALGAAAIGGAGALGWKYWKNRQAMQQDMQNGIPQQ